MKLKGCHALITGASAGLGWEFASQLAPLADSLVLVARRTERLEKLRTALLEGRPEPALSLSNGWRPDLGRDRARPSSLRVEVYPADLSRPEAIGELCDWLAHQKLGVDFLVNNAGLGDLGAFATSDPKRVEDMMMVNMVALTSLTRRLLPAMIAQKRGAILNVSSSASFLPLAGFAVYAATKAYVTSFSEGLRAELRGTGVTVTALCPGPVPTEFSQAAQRQNAEKPKATPGFSHVAAQKVVRAGLYALEADRAIVIPGFLMKLGMFLVRLTPLPVLRLLAQFSAKRG